MYCNCDKCGVEFNLMDGGYLGSKNLRPTEEECHPFMEMTELCSDCYKRELEKLDAKEIQTKAEDR